MPTCRLLKVEGLNRLLHTHQHQRASGRFHDELGALDIEIEPLPKLETADYPRH